MAFKVDDLDTVVAELKRRGVVFEEVDLPGLRIDGGAPGRTPTRAADGLAVHTALRPDLMPPEQIVAVMRLHLDALDNNSGPAESAASV